MTNQKARPKAQAMNSDLYQEMSALTSMPRYGSRRKMMERIELLKRYGKVTVTR